MVILDYNCIWHPWMRSPYLLDLHAVFVKVYARPRMSVRVGIASTTDKALSGLFCHRSIIGLVVEFVVAIDEARVRFTDDAELENFCYLLHRHGARSAHFISYVFLHFNFLQFVLNCFQYILTN